MTFAWPGMLWLLLLIPAAVGGYLWVLRRKQAAAARWANLAMVREAMGGKSSFRRHVPPLLLLASLTLMLLAAARPAAVLTLATHRATIMMVMDVSGSMRAADVAPNRITAAQAAAKAFVKGEPRNVRIGMVAFAGTALLVQPPTVSKEDLDAAIDRFELQRGTAVGSGILVALQSLFPDEQIDLPGFRSGFGFGGGYGSTYGGGYGGGGGSDRSPLDPSKPQGGKKPPGPPVPAGSNPADLIIVMTDGQTNAGADPVEAARMAANHGVKVITVGFGSTDGDVVGFGGRFMRAQLDEEALKQIADMTKGQYFRATNSTELKKIYQGLNTQLIKETKETEVTALFSVAAAVLALLAAGLSMLWFSRIL
ncbi:MAG TPA: VWA domain-containing protein [Caulobacteraceae bacterium]|jgi:Ca-activated chloride channel family protein